jgi:hypothetical protein
VKGFLLNFISELFQSWGVLKYVEHLSQPEFSLALFYLSIFGTLFIIASALLLLFRKEKYLLPSLFLSLLCCFLAAYFMEGSRLGGGDYFSKALGIKSPKAITKVIKGVEVRIPEKKGKVSLPSVSPESTAGGQLSPLSPPPLSLKKMGEVEVARVAPEMGEEEAKIPVPPVDAAPPEADKTGKIIEVTGKSRREALIQLYFTLFDDLFSLPRGSHGFSQLPKPTQKNLIGKIKPLIQLKWVEESEGKTSLRGEVKEKALRDLLQFLGYRFEPTQISFELNKNLTPFEPKEIEQSLPSLIQRRSCFCLNKAFYTSKDNLIREIEAMKFKIQGGIYQVKVVSTQSVAAGEKNDGYIFKVDFIKRG